MLLQRCLQRLCQNHVVDPPEDMAGVPRVSMSVITVRSTRKRRCFPCGRGALGALNAARLAGNGGNCACDARFSARPIPLTFQDRSSLTRFTGDRNAFDNEAETDPQIKPV